jgi:flavin-dependent dehydrogenase
MVAPRSFDGFLLDLAKESGARVIRARVDGVAIEKGRPKIKARNEWHDYDLLAVAIGINSTTSKLFEQLGVGYKTPRGTKAYVCEYLLGTEMIDRYLGSSMHVFLLDLPGLDFAAIIPKGEYVTVCVLGHNVNQELVDTFLHAPEVRECLPPQWQPPTDYCRCSPKLNVQHRTGMFADRIVFLGDCGVTRLYKDGIGAAYGTAKAAALTAILDGIAAEDFRRHYWPVCCRLGRDNQIGKLIFAVTRQIAKHRRLRRAVWRMTLREQRQIGPCPMSQTLWDTFTGSAPYRHVFRRSFDPRFWAPLILEILRPTGRDPQRRPIC